MYISFEHHMRQRRYSPATIKLRLGYLRRFEAFQAAQYGSFDIAAVTLKDLEAFVASNPDWKPATQQTVVASLRTFYKWATREYDLAANPAEDLYSVRVPTTPSRIAPDDVILLALRRGSIQERAMLLLGAECGLRVAEIAALRRGDRRDRWLTILGKGGNTRSVYISPELANVLDSLERDRFSDFYFPGQSGHGHAAPSTIWQHVRNLTHLNTHSLRHRAGTTVYRQTGHDIRLAQTFLGHSSPTTTAIYVHVEDDDLKRASDATRLGPPHHDWGNAA